MFAYATMPKSSFDAWRDREQKRDPRFGWNVWLPLTIGDQVVVLTPFAPEPSTLQRRIKRMARAARSAEPVGASGLVTTAGTGLDKPFALLDPTRPISPEILAGLAAQAAKAWEPHSGKNIMNWSGVPTFRDLRDLDRLAAESKSPSYGIIYRLTRRFLVWATREALRLSETLECQGYGLLTYLQRHGLTCELCQDPNLAESCPIGTLEFSPAYDRAKNRLVDCVIASCGEAWRELLVTAVSGDLDRDGYDLMIKDLRERCQAERDAEGLRRQGWLGLEDIANEDSILPKKISGLVIKWKDSPNRAHQRVAAVVARRACYLLAGPYKVYAAARLDIPMQYRNVFRDVDPDAVLAAALPYKVLRRGEEELIDWVENTVKRYVETMSAKDLIGWCNWELEDTGSPPMLKAVLEDDVKSA